MVKLNVKIKYQYFAFFVFSVALLFASFQWNQFSAANEKLFGSYQHDSESLVVGRLIDSADNGVFSQAGMLGRNTVEETKTFTQIINMQQDIYLSDTHGQLKMWPYLSQIGLQGMFFSLVDRGLVLTGVESPGDRLSAMHMLCVFLLASALSVLLVFIFVEFGLFSACLVLVLLVFSQTLVVMAKNLYWVPFTLYLPMLMAIWALRRDAQGRAMAGWIVFCSIMLLVFVRSATGYEFISAVILACYSPVIYFSIKNHWKLVRFFMFSFLIGGGAVSGFVLANIVHVYQIVILKNQTFIQALYGRISHAKTRMYTDQGTFGAGSWEDATTAPLMGVLNKYWKSHLIDLSHFSNIIVQLNLVAIILLVMTLLVFFLRRYSYNINSQWDKLRALMALMWFSFLAPLSWYVLAKVHSYIHIHINDVLWHLPFTVFGLAFVGFVVSLIYRDLKR